MGIAVGIGSIVVNTLALLAIVWYGGNLVGRLTASVDGLKEDVASLERKLDAHTQYHLNPRGA